MKKKMASLLFAICLSVYTIWTQLESHKDHDAFTYGVYPRGKRKYDRRVAKKLRLGRYTKIRTSARRYFSSKKEHNQLNVFDSDQEWRENSNNVNVSKRDVLQTYSGGDDYDIRNINHQTSNHSRLVDSSPQQENSYVNFHEAIAAFSHLTSESCLSEERKSFRTFEDLDSYIRDHGEPVPLVADNQFFFDFERRMLAFPPLRDMRDTPSLKLSRLVPINREVKDGVIISCEVGDVIEVRADLVDGWGKARTAGFDDVRAWLVEGGGGSRAGAEVRDLHNGSYVVTFPCLWAGSSSQLNVGVAYPREYLRRVLLERRLGIYRFNAGNFGDDGGEAEEWTPCFSTPNIPWPDSSCVCNLTQVNHASFYCGRPRDPRLTCGHLRGTATLHSHHSTAGASQAEIQLMASMVRPPSHFRIQQTLVVNTTTHSSSSSGDASFPASAVACSDIPQALTWKSPSPSGYFDSWGLWRPVLCRAATLTSGQIDQCHTDTQVHIYGDSNALRLTLQAYMLKGACPRGIKLPWNVHQECRSDRLNYTMNFDPHENHMYLTDTGYWPLYKGGGVAGHLDRIPSTGRHVVIVHYYLHITGAHLSAVHDRLVMLRAAVERLTARNPDAVVFFRGPHPVAVDWRTSHSMGGDVQAIFYRRIVKEVFEPIRDRVMLLDGWEMGVALENEVIHPSNSINDGMMRLVLALACGRHSRNDV